MSEADEEKPPEEGGEEEADEGEEQEGEEGEEGAEVEGAEAEGGSQEVSISSSQKGSVTGSGGSRGSVGQYSEGSRSLSTDVELLSHELKEVKDFIGVMYERLFIAAKERKQIEDLPKALQLADEKEQFLERLQNPDLIALLRQTFKRAERGNFAPRQFQKGTDYLELLKNDSTKFERYLDEVGEAIASIEDFLKGGEAPEDLINYKEILEERAQKLNAINNLLMRFLILESCMDSYITELDLARAYTYVKDQGEHIVKLLDYVDLQRRHMDPDSPAFDEWSRVGVEKEPLDNKVEQRLKTVEDLGTQYSQHEENEKDPKLERLIRKHMEELVRSQYLYIQKLSNCIEAQAPYVYEDDEIPDTTEISAEGIYISRCVDEWLMFNGMELNNESKAETELELLKCLKEEIERYIEDLTSELEEMGGGVLPAVPEEDEEKEEEEEKVEEVEGGGEEAEGEAEAEAEAEGGGEEGGEGEGGEGEGEGNGEGEGGGGGEGDVEENGKEEASKEGIVGWVIDSESRKKYLSKIVQEMSAELITIEKNRQVVERRAIYGEKKVPFQKRPKQMPKMSELGRVESFKMPDTVAELKEFCKDVVQKYNCLFKVYVMRMNLNDEKKRQEELRDQVEKVIESKHARKRGIQYEMQLRAALANIESLKQTLKEEKKSAKNKFEVLKNKLEVALEKQVRLQEELGSLQSRMTMKLEQQAKR